MKYSNAEDLLKHILLERLEHRFEHFAEKKGLNQHSRLYNIIDEEKATCLLD